MSESNLEIAKVLDDYKIKEFQKLFAEKFQFSNVDKGVCEQISKWININKSEINLRRDLDFFVIRNCNKSSKSSSLQLMALFEDMERLNEDNDKEKHNDNIVKFLDSQNDSSSKLKIRLHRVLRFKSHDKSVIKEICTEKKLQRRLNKLLELEESVSNLINEQNADTEFVNKLFDEYKSKRNEYLSSVTTTLKILLENVIPRINSEIEKSIQSEGIDSDLEFSKAVIDNLKESKNRIFAGSKQKMIVKEIFGIYYLKANGKQKV